MTTTSEVRPSFGIAYGGGLPPIREQVEAQGFRLTDANADWMQEAADSLTALYVWGVLTRAEVGKARARLHRQVLVAAAPLARTPATATPEGGKDE